jgi:hypothetical protein
MPPQQAYQLVSQRFGAPKTPEQQQKEAAGDAQSRGLAQVGGAVGGALLTNEAMKGFPNVQDALGMGDAAQKGAEAVQTGAQTGAQAGVQAGAPATPKIISVKGNTATVELPNGQTDTLPAEALNDTGFMADIDWGKVGQGGLGALQLYQAYNMAKDKNYAGAGVYGAAGATNVAASGLAGTAAQTAATDALGGYLVPGANLLMGAYGAYQTAEMTGNMAAGTQRNRNAALSGAVAGASIGSAIPIIGTAAGAAIGAAAGYLGSAAFGSKKGKAQFMRDGIRTVLKENKILDENFQGTLADGSKYDFGKDGSTLKWKEIDKVAAAQPKAWEGAVPLANALAASYGFVGQKASDIAAWYAKGAVSNAGDDAGIAQQNMQHFAKQQGITYDMIKGKLDEAIADNRINQSQYDSYLSGAQQLTGGAAPTQQRVQRPGKGQVARVSPGMYMNDQGRVGRASSMRQSLEQNYGKSKGKK